MISHKKLSYNLYTFLSVVFVLLVIGTLFIYSASTVFALELYGNAHYYLYKQLIGIAVGLLALCVSCALPLSFVKKVTPLFLVISLLLTALTILTPLSIKIHGAQRWLHVPGINFQPSELLKIAFILYLALFLERKTHKALALGRGYIGLLIILGLASTILIKQPDFGLMLTIVMTTILTLFIAQFYTRYLALSIVSLIPLISILILFKPYRIQRILTFLNPWQDPKGAGFQIIQSLIAIGSGGWLGVGIGQSKQKFFYLPMQHTDFIFSIIAEETGFIGSMCVVGIYILFLYFGLRLAWYIKTPFSFFTIVGFVLSISLQALTNLAVTTGLLPTKGIGLPFISYGSTALVVNLAMIGLIINMVYTEKYSF